MGTRVNSGVKRTWEVYKDTAGEWRWRVKSSVNGNMLYGSTEGYSSRAKALNAARTELFCDQSVTFIYEDQWYKRTEQVARAGGKAVCGVADPKQLLKSK